MKRSFFSFAFIALVSTSVFAQKPPLPPLAKDQSRNIIISKKGGDKEKMTIVIDGDKVTVNGKPLRDYHGDVRITEPDGNDFDLARPLPPIPPLPPMAAHGGTKNFISSFDMKQNSAFLGVYTESDEAGAKVNSVTKGSPADKAGLKECDVITKIGDDKITGANDLLDIIGKYKPEDKIAVTYLRDKKENSINITLDKNSQQAYSFSSDVNKNFMSTFRDMQYAWDEGKPRLGMRVQDEETGTGVKVTDIEDDDSPAAKAGLKEDDIVTQINGKSISSVKDAKDILNDIKPGDNITINYQRKGTAQTAIVHLPKALQTSDL